MPYSTLTLAQARTQVAQRLSDAGLVFYSGGNGTGNVAFVNSLVSLAVQTWQAYTASYRQRASFATAASTPYYDLKTVLTPSCLAHTTTDQALATLVLALLMEPPLSPSWTGTGMFTFAQIMAAIQNRLSRFLSDSGVGVSRLQVATAAPPSADRTALTDTLTDVRRAGWLSSVSGQTTPLFRDDQWSMQAFNFAGNLTPAEPPQVWGMFTLPPLTIQVYPPPLNSGTLDLLVVGTGVTVGTAPATVFSTPVTLNLPDDFAWGVAFGTISDLLATDGPSRDLARAQYAERRYTEAVELVKANPTVMLTQVNGSPIWTGSVFEMDSFLNNWQSVPGTPQFAGMAGRTTMAFGPIASGIFGVTVDVVSNIPVPVADSDPIDADQGALDAILDYAEHIALFVSGGAEFASSLPLYERFVRSASLVNSRIRNLAVFNLPLVNSARRQREEVVRA